MGLCLHDLMRLATLQGYEETQMSRPRGTGRVLSPETEFDVVDSVLPQRRDVPRIDANS